MRVRKADDVMPIESPEPMYGMEWQGKCKADKSVIKGAGNLNELAGLDREEWTILGATVHGYSHGQDPRWTLRLYAANRRELGIEAYPDWETAAEEHGGVPVVEVLVHDATFEDLVKCMKDVTMQFLSPNMPQLIRTGYADNPEQD